ncbi:MAG TPA: TlpA disulfide reductase family protein [Thermoanaerobaculia bacterium]
MIRALALLAAFVATSATAAELRELANYDAVQHAIESSSAPIRVVNLWATWCAPCAAEMPDLQRIADRFPHIDVIGVSLDDTIADSRAQGKKTVTSFLHERGVKFRNFYFTGGQNQLAEGFKFEGGLPMTFVFDSSGKEVARVVGKIDYHAFSTTLAALEKQHTR